MRLGLGTSSKRCWKVGEACATDFKVDRNRYPAPSTDRKYSQPWMEKGFKLRVNSKSTLYERFSMKALFLERRVRKIFKLSNRVKNVQEMATVNGVINSLTDGKWHKVLEISRSLKIANEVFLETLNFLDKYQFIVYNTTKEMVRLDPKFKDLMTTNSAVKKPRS